MGSPRKSKIPITARTLDALDKVPDSYNGIGEIYTPHEDTRVNPTDLLFENGKPLSVEEQNSKNIGFKVAPIIATVFVIAVLGVLIYLFVQIALA